MSGASYMSDNSFAYCRQLVATSDEDLFISLRYAPDADQPRLAALFAMQVELRRIPALVSEAPLGEIRLQWWREALDELAAGKTPRAHPVIKALHAAGAIDGAARAVSERLIDARGLFLYETEFQSVADMESDLREAEAPLAALSLGAREAMPAQTADDLGAAYALARFAPSLAPSLSNEASSRALQLFNDSVSTLNALSPAGAGRLAFLALTRGYAARADARAWPVAKRLAIFRAVLTGKF